MLFKKQVKLQAYETLLQPADVVSEGVSWMKQVYPQGVSSFEEVWHLTSD